MTHTYSLQKYAGPSSRYTCPNCGGAHKFTRYVDEEGNILAENVGRCDRESSCGYHYTPKQFFQDHPEARPDADDWRKAPDWLKKTCPPCPPCPPRPPVDKVDRCV